MTRGAAFRGWFAAILGGLAILAYQPAGAATLALSHDAGNGESQLLLINAETGFESPVGSVLTDCCELGIGTTAADPQNRHVYAIGPDATRALRLMRFNMDGSGAGVVGPLGSNDRALALAFDTQARRLLALLANTEGRLRLFALDTGSGHATEINAGLGNCCTIEPGLAIAGNGGLSIVGQLRDDPATRRLIHFSASGDNAVTSTPLAARLAALAIDPASGRTYALQQTTGAPALTASTRLVELLEDGTLAPRGAGLAQCCTLLAGAATIADGRLLTLAAPLGSGSFSLLSATLADGALAFSSNAVASGTAIDGLFASELSIDTSIVIAEVTPSPIRAGDPYTVRIQISSVLPGPLLGVVVVTDSAGGTCTITLPADSCAIVAAHAHALRVTATFTGADGTTTASTSGVFPVAGAIVPIPTLSAALLGALAMLLALLVVLRQRPQPLGMNRQR